MLIQALNCSWLVTFQEILNCEILYHKILQNPYFSLLFTFSISVLQNTKNVQFHLQMKQFAKGHIPMCSLE